MKKKITLGFMGLMLCTMMQAQERTVTLYNDDLENYDHSYEIPTINYDDYHVTISANTLIYNVTVVIRDIAGNVIYRCTTTVNPADRILNLPLKYQEQKYTVEVIYDDKYMYGYFEK